MLATKCRSVLRLYDWLPSYGEHRIRCRFDNMQLFIDVFYDSADKSTEQCQTIVFTSVCDFRVSCCPGVELGAIEYVDPEKLTLTGDLVEYEESEAAEAWSQHFGDKKIRHFDVFFLSDNSHVEVFAESWELQPATSEETGRSLHAGPA
jgi:hypothetical protein